MYAYRVQLHVPRLRGTVLSGGSLPFAIATAVPAVPAVPAAATPPDAAAIPAASAPAASSSTRWAVRPQTDALDLLGRLQCCDLRDLQQG